MRLAHDGYWGFGTYFSDSSSYSHSYAFKVKNQHYFNSNFIRIMITCIKCFLQK